MKYENFDVEEENPSFFRRCFQTRAKKAAFISFLIILAASAAICAFSLKPSMKVESCVTRPCENSGSCDTYRPCHGSWYPSRGMPVILPKCSCPDGFSGDFCEITPCTENPCQNGGSCTVTMEKEEKWRMRHLPAFECACTPEFSGPDCGYSSLLVSE